MQITFLFQQLGIALGLGLLVGLQRESAATRLGGLRTFPLVTLFGTISALLSQTFGGWVLATGLVGLAGLIFAGKLAESEEGKPDPGLTTEVAMLLMFGVGAYLVVGYREVAIALGGGIAVLLHFKGELHNAAARLDAGDLKAIMQFALISLVILPVLPDRAYGPYQVLNPRNIWLMVVLIVGISVSGYIAYKFLGGNVGLLLGGVLGGLISSTATSVSYARRTSSAPDASKPAAIVILIASSIVFARVLLEITAVAPPFLPSVIYPLLTLMAAMAVIACGIWFWGRDGLNTMPEQENPSELKSALFFGMIYAVVLLATAFAKDRFGSKGLFLVAGISGLTDVDAITLSTSRLVNNQQLSSDQGWRLIVIAIMSNLIFKTIILAALGHHRLLLWAGSGFGLTLLTGVAVLLLWPAAS